MKNISTIDVFVERLLLFMGDLTQYELATRSDLPYSTIKSILQKRTKDINYKTIMKIAKGLNIKPWKLVEDEHLTADYLDLD